MEREVGGGIGMGNTCKPMAVSFQCMTKSTANKNNNNKKKKRYLYQIAISRNNFILLRESYLHNKATLIKKKDLCYRV